MSATAEIGVFGGSGFYSFLTGVEERRVNTPYGAPSDKVALVEIDGRRVAFQSQISGVFQIMAINLRDRSVQAFTSEGRNTEPSWAPDSRHLLFTSTRSGTSQLWVLDTESGRTRQLTRVGKARLGAWSPRLDTGR